jgi:hypothetical protein
MWQSIPYADERKEPAGPTKAVASTKPAMAKPVRTVAAARRTAPKSPRRPVAASTPHEPPRTSAGAKARELARPIEALSPGTKLDEPIHDPQNPRWRRPRPSSAGPDGSDLAIPFDDSGRSGFVARGYHTDPNWENPRGTLGATFGLRTRF